MRTRSITLAAALGAASLWGLASATATPVEPNRPLLTAVDDASIATSETRGRLDAVTVYRGQALVTRAIEAPGPQGLREIVITDLPEHILPESLHAESAGGVTIRSVRYRERPVIEDIREEVRAIDTQIRDLEDQTQQIQAFLNVLKQRSAYLERLEQFTAETASTDLSRGVLDPAAIKEVTTLIFDQRREIAAEEIKFQRELRDLKDRMNLLNREKSTLSGSSSRTAREAVVFLNVEGPNGGSLHLRYLVNRASWQPSYNMRTDARRSAVVVEYNASVSQMSGEDWTNVRMTLSTATPALDAKAPTLDPLAISLVPSGQVTLTVSQDEYLAISKNLEDRRQQVQLQRNSQTASAFGGGGRADADARSRPAQEGAQILSMGDDFAEKKAALVLYDKALNSIADELQVLELGNAAQLDLRRAQTPGRSNGISVTYQLDGRTSLPSRSDQQLIQIATASVSGEFYRVSVPVLTNGIYEEARVTNSSGLVLLAGPVETYLDGQFVGRADLPTVSAGESFTVGFGSDASLRASRELIQRDESIQGGNKVVTLRYRMTVENFGDAPRAVRVLDRMPQAPEGQVKLTLVESTPEPIATDAAKVDREKKGILRWNIDAPANRTGSDAVSIEYVVRLEYDKQMTIQESTVQP